MEPVQLRTYANLPPDRKLIRAYARAGTTEPPLLDACLAEAGPPGGQVCWRCYPLAFGAGTLDLGFAETDSKSLRKHLDGCAEIVLFAATAGLGCDRLIARYAHLSPAKALLFQAIGAACVETVCDAFCADLERERGPLRSRYSPGYGDLPLALQKDIFAALDCRKYLGLTLNESLLMTPSKSVTAIVGIH